MRCFHFAAVAVILTWQAGQSAAATIHVPREHKTIQAAIDAARPGDMVLVEPGTYRERIQLKEKVTLKSAGDDAKGRIGLKRAEDTVIEGEGRETKGPGVIMAEGAVLDGFTVTKIGLFDQKEYDKHYATHGEDLADERGAVGTGTEFPAVAASGVTALVRHCLVHDNGYAGIGCTGAEGKRNTSMISSNVVYRNMGGGIGIADGATSVVEGNRCDHNLRGGIGNRKSSGLIVGNECHDNVRAGIGIREGATPMVRKNKCYQNRRAGIGIRMAGTAPVVEDNDCHENAMAGIGCRDGAAPLIRGNRCYENTLAGIGSRDGARPIVFGNRCYRNKEAGIGSELGARPFIAHNECYENDKAGIAQRSDADTIIGGNHVHHNKLAGIGFEECKAGKSIVIHNKIIDNERVALGIHGGWQVRVVSNELSRQEGMPALVMVFKGAEAEFNDNTFRGIGVAGIRAEGVIRVLSNRFECPEPRKGGGPPQYAVWGLPGADIVFTANTVNGWRHALVADKASVLASHNQVSNYWQTGIRITQATSPPTVLANLFTSEQEHPGVVITGDQGIVMDNRVEKPAPRK